RKRNHQGTHAMKLMKSLLKEPFVHFLALGAVIFALNTWREKTRPIEASAAQIEVTAAVIDRLCAGYERQFGQAPDAEEPREIPTPRWTAYDAKRFGVKPLPGTRMTTTERA